VTIPLFTRFYGRSVRVILGAAFIIENLRDDGPRISFDFRSNNSREPDECTIRIWNLSKVTRDAIRLIVTADDSLRVRLHVGYEGRPQQVFDGQTTNVDVGRRGNGTDIVTIFEIADGAKAFREGFINASFVAGTPVSAILTAIITAMQLLPAPGSIELFTAKLSTSILQAISGGFVVNGRAADSLDVLCSLTGLRWFIRENMVVFENVRTLISDVPQILNPSTGLLWVSEPQGLDSIRARALLTPTLVTGRQVIIQNEFFLPVGAPAYAIESMRGTGDTEGGPWGAELDELRAVGS
jgi:hypothetical protein